MRAEQTRWALLPLPAGRRSQMRSLPPAHVDAETTKPVLHRPHAGAESDASAASRVAVRATLLRRAEQRPMRACPARRAPNCGEGATEAGSEARPRPRDFWRQNFGANGDLRCLDRFDAWRDERRRVFVAGPRRFCEPGENRGGLSCSGATRAPKLRRIDSSIEPRSRPGRRARATLTSRSGASGRHFIMLIQSRTRALGSVRHEIEVLAPRRFGDSLAPPCRGCKSAPAAGHQ